MFSYGGNASTNATSGDGTTVVISDSTITTTGNGSAAVRSDRGGGTVTVNRGTYKTSGSGSPAIYATATIIVNNATLTSTASQGVVNEGGNSVTLNNCTVNAGDSKLGSQDYFKNGIFLYQSISGDASEDASAFAMTGGTLNNTYGHVFHVTNTSAAINLSGSSVWTGATSGSITAHRNSSKISSSIGTVNVTLGSGSVNYGSYTLYVNGTAYTASSPYSGTGQSSSSLSNSSSSSNIYFSSPYGVVQGSDGNWYYVENGVIQTGYTGIMPNEYGWWRIVNGLAVN